MTCCSDGCMSRGSCVTCCGDGCVRQCVHVAVMCDLKRIMCVYVKRIMCDMLQ